MMIAEYDSDPKLVSINLAQHDKTEELLIPQKIFGRSTEYSALFSSVARLGPNSFEIAFITGIAGIGKSLLAFELQKAIIQVTTNFIHSFLNLHYLKFFQTLREEVFSFAVNIINHQLNRMAH